MRKPTTSLLKCSQRASNWLIRKGIFHKPGHLGDHMALCNLSSDLYMCTMKCMHKKLINILRIGICSLFKEQIRLSTAQQAEHLPKAHWVLAPNPQQDIKQ